MGWHSEVGAFETLSLLDYPALFETRTWEIFQSTNFFLKPYISHPELLCSLCSLLSSQIHILVFLYRRDINSFGTPLLQKGNQLPGIALQINYLFFLLGKISLQTINFIQIFCIFPRKVILEFPYHCIHVYRLWKIEYLYFLHTDPSYLDTIKSAHDL